MSPTSNAPRSSPISTTIAVLIVAGLAVAGCGEDSADEDGDIVSITAPGDDDYVNDRRVEIEGTVDGDHSVEVNGYPADVDDGHWSVDVDYDTDGRVTATAEAGGDEESVTFVIDTHKPDFEITDPPRGSVIDADADQEGTVTVRGDIGKVGQSGLQLFEINGRSIDTAEGESFETEITLDEGFNRLNFKAIDGAHNEVESNRGAIYGPLTEPDSSIDEAAQLDVDEPSGIQALTDIVEAYVTPERISQYVVAGFQDQDDIPVDVEITDIDWEEMDLSLNPTDGLLEITLIFTDLQVDGEFPEDDEDEEPVEGTIQIDELTVEMDLELSTDDNDLVIDVVDDAIDAPGMTITLDGDEASGWLEAAAELALVIAFEEFVGDLIEDNLYDPEMLTQEVEFVDRTIVFSLLLEEIHVSTNGITIGLGLEFPGDRHEDVPDVPGALDRPVEASMTGSVDRPVLFHTTRTAADRLMHGIWETGLFHQNVGSDDLSDFTLPFELTADGLGTLLDSRIRDIHETDTPAKFGFRPLLPPVVEFTDEESASARIGDFLLDILLVPRDEAAADETRVVTLALHLDIDFDIVIDDDEIGLDLDIDASGDIADEPRFSFDRADTIDLITEILEILPPLLDDELKVEAEQQLEWATVSDPILRTHGQPRDRATVGVDISPADDYIDGDDVDEDPDDNDD